MMLAHQLERIHCQNGLESLRALRQQMLVLCLAKHARNMVKF